MILQQSIKTISYPIIFFYKLVFLNPLPSSLPPSLSPSSVLPLIFTEIPRPADNFLFFFFFFNFGFSLIKKKIPTQGRKTFGKKIYIYIFHSSYIVVKIISANILLKIDGIKKCGLKKKKNLDRQSNALIFFFVKFLFGQNKKRKNS